MDSQSGSPAQHVADLPGSVSQPLLRQADRLLSQLRRAATTDRCQQTVREYASIAGK